MTDAHIIALCSNYLEERLHLLKDKYLSLAQTGSTPGKKANARQIVKDIEADVSNLQQGRFTTQHLVPYGITVDDLIQYLGDLQEELSATEKLDLLTLTPNASVHLNYTWSYYKYCEREYLPLFSSSNLPLDYQYSPVREQVCIDFSNILRLFEKIIDADREMQKIRNSEYQSRLIETQKRLEKDLDEKISSWILSTRSFIVDIQEQQQNNNLVMMNPEKIVTLPPSAHLLYEKTAWTSLQLALGFLKSFAKLYEI